MADQADTFRNRIQTVRRPGAMCRVDLTLRRRWFEGDGDSGDQQSQTTDTSAGHSDGQSGDAGKTFTQAELDKIIADRLKRAEEKARKDFLAGLGVENEDTLKQLLEDKKQREDAEKTELQKTQDDLKKAMADLQAANERAAKIEQERLIERRDAHIREALRKARSTKPDAVLILMSASKPDLVNAVMGEDGKIDEKAVTALVEEARKEHKEFFGSNGAGSPSNNNGYTPGADNTEERRTARERTRRFL